MLAHAYAWVHARACRPVSAMVVGGLVSVLGWWGKRAEGGVMGGLVGACLCTGVV